MLRVAVVGFTGRVNKAIIEELPHHPKCILSGILVRNKNIDNPEGLILYDNIEELAENSDAIIDFTNPTTTLTIAEQINIPNKILVSGTTGFTEKEFNQLKSHSNKFPIIWSANMSIGINILHELLQLTVPKLGKSFDSAIIDIHHRHKKDSPSGTAKMLSETIRNCPNHGKLEISSLRIGEELGEHQVIFSGHSESITITHRAHSRKSYAEGAIKACLWGKNKPSGFYTMHDVLNY
jgi:4-hydroxy-tetrahydrodipicolinate reductase